MEQLAHRAVALNAKEQDYTKLLSLFDLTDTEEVLRRNVSQIDSLLSQLDAATQTLSFLLFLKAKTTYGTPEPEIFISQVDHLFAVGASIQIQRATGSVRKVVETYTSLHIERQTPVHAIKTLRLAITKTSNSPEQLTSVHAQYLKLCLLGKCYHLAFPVVEQDIFEIDPKGTKPYDYMTYFYYGGMVYIGLKQFSRAIHFFKLAFTVPASTTSSIMIESYKKFVLASLIHNGSVPSFPPEVEGGVVRQIKNNCSHYAQLGEVFATNDVTQFQQFCESNQEVFNSDKNLGLLHQVADSLYEKLILMYTKCYVTLSLDDIAKGVKLPSADVAEKYMLRMIEQGKICAVINLQDGMVNFGDSFAVKFNDTQSTELHKHIHKSMELSRRLENLKDKMKSSEEFIIKKQNTAGKSSTPSNPPFF